MIREILVTPRSLIEAKLRAQFDPEIAAVLRASRVRRILEGRKPSPERRKMARQWAADHLDHLLGSDEFLRDEFDED